jgi:hypothetical protein
MTIWFHPQRGSIVTDEKFDKGCLRYRGGPDDAWRIIGEPLPKGFLWGDPAKQQYGMGGPQEVFGPLERVCRDCKKEFVFPAAEQKYWLETLGFHIDSTATRCLGCRTVRRKQRSYADAVNETKKNPTARAFLNAAKAALAWHKAGGRAPLAKAVAHCRRAQKLGLDAAPLLTALRDIMKK